MLKILLGTKDANKETFIEHLLKEPFFLSVKNI